jgi:hypothetical protein
MMLRGEWLDPRDLPAYRSLGEKFFPETNWDRGLVRLRSMLEKWPRGIFCVYEQNAIEGYMTLWPLLPEVIPDLESGRLGDDQIAGPHVASPATPHPFWLMSAVAVVPAEKDRRRAVIGKLLEQFHSTVRANAPCRVFAHAVTADGVRFCTRTGFRFLYPAVKALCVYQSS